MNEYKGLINKILLDNYKEVLIIDVFSDKIFKYVVKDSDFLFDSQLSYMKYLDECKNFIHADDVDNYIESLSMSRLENEENGIVLNYRMHDKEYGTYREYVNNIILFIDNENKYIIVLVSLVKNNTISEKEDGVKYHIENKLNKMVDSVGLAILKIHNIINNDSSMTVKCDYINSILSSLTKQFPEFNEALNDNAMSLEDNGKSTILIIDDDKMTCSLIKKVFDKNYDVIIANNGQEAIEYLKECDNGYNLKNNISCIFLDLIMPVLDGFSVLNYLHDNNYLIKIPVVIISGNYDKETRNKAYSYQIADMLEKPFNVQVVRHRIENLIGLYRSSNSINSMMLEQHKELRNIISSLIVSYELDNGTCMEMVRKYTRVLAMQVSVQYPEYNINSNMIDKIANSACYYAIGNYTLPKSILCKKGMYTEEERSIIKSASINGANVVKRVLANFNNEIDPTYCYQITKYYNERYDGNGYPEGLSGNSIPLSCQIASLAIEYNNLINTIQPVDYEKVASLIIMESGRKFSPKIVDSFKKVKLEFEAITKIGG